MSPRPAIVRRNRCVATLVPVFACLMPCVPLMTMADAYACVLHQDSAEGDDLATLRDYLSANGLLNRGMYALAAEEYQRFLEAHPDHERSPVARYGLGVALYRQGKFDAAIIPLRRIASLDAFAFAPEANLLLGQSLLQLQKSADAIEPLNRIVSNFQEHNTADEASALLVEAFYREKQYDRASTLAAAFVTKWPDHALADRVAYFHALSEIDRNRHQHARAPLQRIIERDPNGPLTTRAMLILAQSEEHLDQLDRASMLYRQVAATEDAGVAPQALLGLGVVERRRNNPKAAIEALTMFVRRHSAHRLIDEAQLELGLAFYDLEAYRDAIEELERVSSTNSSIADDARYWIAKAQLRLDDAASASATLGEALAAYPSSDLRAEMSYDHGVSLLRAGHADAAISAFRDFVAHHDKHTLVADALRLLAKTAHRQERWGESTTFARALIDRFPKDAHRAEMAFLIAENAYLSGDFEDAVSRYSQFLERYPDNTQATAAVYRLGMAHNRLDHSDEARRWLDQVIDGGNTPSVYAPALLTLGQIAFDEERWADAEELLTDYLSFDVSEANLDDALIRLALAQQRQAKYDSAIHSYGRLLEERSESPHIEQAIFERGQSMIGLEKLDDAKRAFDRLLKAYPKSQFAVAAHTHLGSIAMRQKQYDDAETHFRAVAEQSTDAASFADAQFQRGQALLALERFDDAERAFVAALDAGASEAAAPLTRAKLLIAHARQAENQAVIDTFAHLNQASLKRLDDALHANVLYELAWAHRSLDQPDEAIKAYELLIDVGAESELSTYARVELGELFASRQQWKNAAQVLAQIAFDDETIPEALRARGRYRIGVAAFEQKQFGPAAQHLSTYLASNPESGYGVSAALLAGEAHFQLQQFDRAEAMFRRVQKHADDDGSRSTALLRLGDVLARQQKWRDALEAFQKHRTDFPSSKLWFQAQFGVGWALENQGSFEKAIEAYLEVVNHHQGETAARAQFQIGECYFAMESYDAAVRELLKVDILYGYPEWSAAALFEAGKCFEAMAKVGEARQQYEQVTKQFPESRWADMAASRLAVLSRRNLPGRTENR